MMIKYAKIVDQETKRCMVGIGTNSAFYQKIGLVEMEVEYNEEDECYYAVENKENNTVSID